MTEKLQVHMRMSLPREMQRQGRGGRTQTWLGDESHMAIKELLSSMYEETGREGERKSVFALEFKERERVMEGSRLPKFLPGSDSEHSSSGWGLSCQNSHLATSLLLFTSSWSSYIHTHTSDASHHSVSKTHPSTGTVYVNMQDHATPFLNKFQSLIFTLPCFTCCRWVFFPLSHITVHGGLNKAISSDHGGHARWRGDMLAQSVLFSHHNNSMASLVQSWASFRFSRSFLHPQNTSYRMVCNPGL